MNDNHINCIIDKDVVKEKNLKLIIILIIFLMRKLFFIILSE